MPKARHHKYSQAEISKLVGVSPRTLREWRDIEGLELGDIEAVKARAGHVAPDTAPATGETISEAKRRRAVADADFAELRAQREAKTLIDLATVEAAFAAVGHELRSHLLALPNSAASELEGLGAAQIAQALKTHVLEILTQLYENTPAASATPKPAPSPAEKPS